MVRIIIYALLIYLAYRIVKSWSGLSLDSSSKRSQRPAKSEETELIRDPHCGIYFLKQRGFEARIGGESRYFCSPECRDKYMSIHKKD